LNWHRGNWKAVKIGHGPATVIGPLRGKREVESQERPREPDEASTLREKESGDQPRYPREAFFVGGSGEWLVASG